jgi:segregation and condensation protein B
MEHSESEVLIADQELNTAASSEEIAPEIEEEQEPLPELEDGEKVGLLQALLFASSEPISPGRIAEITKFSTSEVTDLIESLQMNLELEDSGMELRQIGGKYQLRTKAKFAPFLRILRGGKPKKLSEPALETLAIIAYRQPIVKSDIEKIRGVDATPTLKTLVDRRLIRIVGHKETAGLPALYGTTELFLKVFGLSNLSGLPSLRDLRELESDPGEIGEESDASFDDASDFEVEDTVEDGNVQ